MVHTYIGPTKVHRALVYGTYIHRPVHRYTELCMVYGTYIHRPVHRYTELCMVYGTDNCMNVIK